MDELRISIQEELFVLVVELNEVIFNIILSRR